MTVDGVSRYFANNVGLGLDADVAVDAARGQVFTGFAMYLWSVLRVIAFGNWPYAMQISLNNTVITRPITLITVSNGVRAGGGFLLTPQADLSDGVFDICYAERLSKLRLLWLLPKTFNGTHTHDPAVTLTRADRLRISVPGGSAAHIDGEILCQAGQNFEFTLLPQALRVWA